MTSQTQQCQKSCFGEMATSWLNGLQISLQGSLGVEWRGDQGLAAYKVAAVKTCGKERLKICPDRCVTRVQIWSVGLGATHPFGQCLEQGGG